MTGFRDYELDIELGQLYEVWLHHDGQKELAIPYHVYDEKSLFAGLQLFDCLVNGRREMLFSTQLFTIGTATRPAEFAFNKKAYVVNQPLYSISTVTALPYNAPNSTIFTTVDTIYPDITYFSAKYK